MLKYRRIRIDIINNYTKNLVKIIMSKFEILQSNKSKREIIILDNYINDEIIINKKMAPYVHFFFRVPWFTMSLLILLGFYYIWGQILNWEIKLSVLVWLSWALIIMQKSIIDSIKFYKDFTKEFTIIEKLWDLFDNTPEVSWYNSWKKFKHIKWKIEINNLNFSYSKNKPIFQKFNIKISWKKVTALVWNSWSGKSTLIKLIAWFIKPDSWNIIIDDQHLSKISLKSYYKDIWYLTQEPSVFDWTILDNLMYDINNDVGKDVWNDCNRTIDKILKQAKCEFIYDLPNWINTEIWEKWIRLSWGQRQRLAIAKILLKDPKIILLDEPTSALDSFSEELITKAMHNLFKWRTIIIIAHRLQTVKNADDIILIKDWKIKERWTHTELIKKKWTYKKMLDLQSGF